MSHPIFKQCERSISAALETLRFLQKRCVITAKTIEDIRLHRQTADIALQGTFEELRHAFITPIDREEMWHMRQITECVAHCAEEACVALWQEGCSAPSPNDTALLAAVFKECSHLRDAVAAFPYYPRTEQVLVHLKEAERQHRLCEGIGGREPLQSALKKLSAACFDAAESLRYILLKSL